jgi:hypothetical protein
MPEGGGRQGLQIPISAWKEFPVSRMNWKAGGRGRKGPTLLMQSMVEVARGGRGQPQRPIDKANYEAHSASNFPQQVIGMVVRAKLLVAPTPSLSCLML